MRGKPNTHLLIYAPTQMEMKNLIGATVVIASLKEEMLPYFEENLAGPSITSGSNGCHFRATGALGSTGFQIRLSAV